MKIKIENRLKFLLILQAQGNVIGDQDGEAVANDVHVQVTVANHNGSVNNNNNTSLLDNGRPANFAISAGANPAAPAPGIRDKPCLVIRYDD